MKKLLTIALSGIIAVNANAQLTPEGIMALLPDMPSQTVMIGVATHNTEFNDRSADIIVWDEFFEKLQEVIDKAEDAAAREQKNAVGAVSKEQMKAKAEAAAGISVEKVQSMSQEELIAFAKSKAKGKSGALNGMTLADLQAMSNMSEADRVEYAMANGLTMTPDQVAAMKSKPAGVKINGSAVMKYQELMTKGAEMARRPEKILDEARQAIYEIWKNGYKKNYDAASKKEQDVFKKYGEDPEGVTEYTAAKLQVHKVTSEFKEKSYVLWRNAVLNAMTFIKTDYLLYTRQLEEVMEQMGNPAPGQDMAVALQYLRQAMSLRDIPNPINE